MKFNRLATISSSAVVLGAILVVVIHLNSAANASPDVRNVSFSLSKDYTSFTQLSKDANFILVMRVDSVNEVGGLSEADMPLLKISGTVQQSIKGGLVLDATFDFNMPGDLTGDVIFSEDIPPAPSVGSDYLIYSNFLFPNDPDSNRWLTGMCGILLSDGKGVYTLQGEIMPQLPQSISLVQARNSAI